MLESPQVVLMGGSNISWIILTTSWTAAACCCPTSTPTGKIIGSTIILSLGISNSFAAHTISYAKAILSSASMGMACPMVKPIISQSYLAASGRILSILSLIHISEPTRLRRISYAVFCLKKKKKKTRKKNQTNNSEIKNKQSQKNNNIK